MDYKGKLNPLNVQTNSNRHPFMGNGGGEKFSIRLKGNVEIPGMDYDEWDCIEDMIREGLLESYGTGIHPIYQITDKGSEISRQLRLHKARGENFHTFLPSYS